MSPANLVVLEFLGDVHALLQAGADWELRDAAGKSALERAEGEDTAAVLGA